MKYSVVIPSLTLTDQHYVVLAETMDALRNSIGDHTEIILIDDASGKDLSEFILHTNTFVRHRDNRGIAKSWNEGIKLARGEYVAIINDDIIMTRHWLDALANALDFDDDYYVSAPGVIGKQGGHGIIEDYQWFPGYCFMLKRETIEKIGLFDEQFSPFNFEDTDYWTRVLKAGKKLVRNYSTVITHREGHVLHTLDYNGVSATNKEKFVKKHHFDPIPVFYEGAPMIWTN